MALKHVNSGACAKCNEIMARYPNIYQPLRDWFKGFQAEHPEAHISCAGRGRDDQDMLFRRRASRAKYGQSAHNYNAALDIFELTSVQKDIYETKWFIDVLSKEIPDWMTWYGWPGSKFYELPHVEVENWKELATKGILKPVDGEP